MRCADIDEQDAEVCVQRDYVVECAGRLKMEASKEKLAICSKEESCWRLQDIVRAGQGGRRVVLQAVKCLLWSFDNGAHQSCLLDVPENVPLQNWGILCIIDHREGDAKVPIKEVVDLEVVVVFPKRVVEGLGHSQPAKVEEELDCHEDWVVDVELQRRMEVKRKSVREKVDKKSHFHLLTLGPLFSNERDSEVDVHSKSHNLGFLSSQRT